MSKKVENQKNPQLFFVSYNIGYNGKNEELYKKFPIQWVRRLNITHSELCEELRIIESWEGFTNSDGTQVVGRNLTILPSETMDEKMDVNSDVVKIKNNHLTIDEKPITLQKYLYGEDGFINMCWNSTQVKKQIELGMDVDNHPYFENYNDESKRRFIDEQKKKKQTIKNN